MENTYLLRTNWCTTADKIIRPDEILTVAGWIEFTKLKAMSAINGNTVPSLAEMATYAVAAYCPAIVKNIQRRLNLALIEQLSNHQEIEFAAGRDTCKEINRSVIFPLQPTGSILLNMRSAREYDSRLPHILVNNPRPCPVEYSTHDEDNMEQKYFNNALLPEAWYTRKLLAVLWLQQERAKEHSCTYTPLFVNSDFRSVTLSLDEDTDPILTLCADGREAIVDPATLH